MDNNVLRKNTKNKKKDRVSSTWSWTLFTLKSGNATDLSMRAGFMKGTLSVRSRANTVMLFQPGKHIFNIILVKIYLEITQRKASWFYSWRLRLNSCQVCGNLVVVWKRKRFHAVSWFPLYGLRKKRAIKLLINAREQNDLTGGREWNFAHSSIFSSRVIVRTRKSHRCSQACSFLGSTTVATTCMKLSNINVSDAVSRLLNTLNTRAYSPLVAQQYEGSEVLRAKMNQAEK